MLKHALCFVLIEVRVMSSKCMLSNGDNVILLGGYVGIHIYCSIFGFYNFNEVWVLLVLW